MTIISTIAFAATFFLLGRCVYLNSRLNRRVKSLKTKLNNMNDACMSGQAKYIIGTSYYKDEYYPTVYRVVTTDGSSFTTVIKVFDTEDKEYNENCAIELADKLNEELCYDMPLFKAVMN